MLNAQYAIRDNGSIVSRSTARARAPCRT
jgi:hypothetical protein